MYYSRTESHFGRHVRARQASRKLLLWRLSTACESLATALLSAAVVVAAAVAASLVCLMLFRHVRFGVGVICVFVCVRARMRALARVQVLCWCLVLFVLHCFAF